VTDEAPAALVPPDEIKNAPNILGGKDKRKPNRHLRPDIPDGSVTAHSAAEMMRLMGFDPTSHMTPLQFLVAVINDRTDLVYKNESKRNMIELKGGIGISYRVLAAQTAVKYMHQEMPKLQVNINPEGKFADALSKSLARAEQRVYDRAAIIDEAGRFVVEVPLGEANYPPVFKEGAEDFPGSESLNGTNAEGDTNYNPDNPG